MRALVGEVEAFSLIVKTDCETDGPFYFYSTNFHSLKVEVQNKWNIYTSQIER